MVEDPEPAENIAGGSGEAAVESRSGQSPHSRAERVVDRLGELYWRKAYGGQDAFACLVRTILSQNTSDVASQPAFDALIDRYGESEIAAALREAPEEEIIASIRPAGLYNQKAEVLGIIADRVETEFGGQDAFDRFVRSEPYETVRDELLSMRGVGPKTADCVLLFAGGREGVFPVDTHVHRVYRRLGVAPANADHEAVRAILEGRTEGSEGVPPEKCGFGHTATIQFGREYCRARSPVCLEEVSKCPLANLCDQVGVDRTEGTVVDPAETVE